MLLVMLILEAKIPEVRGSKWFKLTEEMNRFLPLIDHESRNQQEAVLCLTGQNMLEKHMFQDLKTIRFGIRSSTSRTNPDQFLHPLFNSTTFLERHSETWCNSSTDEKRNVDKIPRMISIITRAEVPRGKVGRHLVGILYIIFRFRTFQPCTPMAEITLP